MSKQINRRDLLAAGLAGGAMLGLPGIAAAQINRGAAGRVVVVGGGFGGATAARYLKLFDPGLDVTLVDRDAVYTTCPFSNYVLGGIRDLGSIQHRRDPLNKRWGVRLVQG
uniref:FAD-dependent oxidoreductase n=1 Tax=Ferrovibrio sp. TaxID=1917215 RepID=UPI001B4A65BB